MSGMAKGASELLRDDFLPPPPPRKKEPQPIEDDPVVGEYEVRLSSEMFDSLHVLQFPLRSAGRPYNLEKVKSMKMQKETQTFEMTFNNSVQGSGFDLPNEQDPHQLVLTSSRVKRKCNYAIGLFRNQTLHITGLQHIHQLRPELCKNLKVNPDKLSDAQTPLSSHSLSDYRMRSIWLKKRQSHPWTDVKFLSSSRGGSVYIERLAASENSSVVCFNQKQTTEQLLQTMFKYNIDATAQKIPLAHANEYDWKHQADSLAVSAKIIRFATIKSLLKVKPGKQLPSESDLISHLLDSVCVLINGLFVARNLSEFTKTEALAREWILMQFWKKRELKRSAVRVPPFNLMIDDDAIKNIMSDVAVLVTHSDHRKRLWKLKCGGCDNDFISAYPKMCAEQDMAWERRVPLVIANCTSESDHNTLTMPLKERDYLTTAKSKSSAINKEIAKFVSQKFESSSVWNYQVLYSQFIKSHGPQYADNIKLVLEVMTRPFNGGIIRKTLTRNREDIDRYRLKYIQMLIERRQWPLSEFSKNLKNVPPEIHKRIMKELATINAGVVTAKISST